MSQSQILADRIRDPEAPKLQDKYMMAFPIEKKPKTWVYGVVSLSQGWRLGLVKWYAPWRQYCFFPESEAIFSRSCLKKIIEFTQALMFERRISNNSTHKEKEK